MKMHTRANALTAALGLVLVAGCGSDDSASSGSGSGSGSASTEGERSSSEEGSASTEPTTVDTMFGDVEIPEPEDGELTVVALGWSDAEMALALDVVPVATVDWQGFGAENKGVGPWATDMFGDVDPEIIERGDESLNYEQLQTLEPDLILNTRSGNEEQEFNRLSEIAPTVYAPEGTGAFATGWKDQITIIGEAVGKPEEAQTLVEDTQATIDEAAAAHPEFEGTTVASVAKFGDAYGAYLPGDGRFDILSELGFVNNPPIDDLESSGFFANVSAENINVFDADTAVVLPIGYTLEETQSDSLLTSLEVVKQDRAIFLKPDTELSGAWGASSVLSIPIVVEQIVPRLAEATDRL